MGDSSSDEEDTPYSSESEHSEYKSDSEDSDNYCEPSTSKRIKKEQQTTEKEGREWIRSILQIIPKESEAYETLLQLNIRGVAKHFRTPIVVGLLKWKCRGAYDKAKNYKWKSIWKTCGPIGETQENLTEMQRWLIKCSIVYGPLPQSLVDMKPPVTDEERAAHALVTLETRIYLANPTFGWKEIHKEVKRILSRK